MRIRARWTTGVVATAALGAVATILALPGVHGSATSSYAQAATASNPLPASHAAELENLFQDRRDDVLGSPMEPDVSTARSLGAVDGHDVARVPTTDGHLCLSVESIAQTCGSPFRDGETIKAMLVDVDAVGAGSPLYVVGIVADTVKSVNVKLRGVNFSVRPVDGYFVLRAPDNAVTPGDVGKPVAS